MRKNTHAPVGTPFGERTSAATLNMRRSRTDTGAVTATVVLRPAAGGGICLSPVLGMVTTSAPGGGPIKRR